MSGAGEPTSATGSPMSASGSRTSASDLPISATRSSTTSSVRHPVRSCAGARRRSSEPAKRSHARASESIASRLASGASGRSGSGRRRRSNVRSPGVSAKARARSSEQPGPPPATTPMTIRNAFEPEASALEGLQRRSSEVWAEFRAQLAAHPDAIEFPQHFIDRGWTRVAVLDGAPAGFSVVIPGPDGTHELDGLFVEPDQMHRGIGRALVEDACERAASAGAQRLEVTAGPAQGFYEKLGFTVLGRVQTRFA